MAILGTTRLKVANGSAAVTKLWNDRYRLEFICDPVSDKTDWYHDNIGGILPDFTASQDDFFGTGVNEGWQAIPESVYPNMVCVEASYPYIPSIGEKRVSLAYETLTDEWVQEKDDTIDYELNGLKRVSRVSVALPGTAYSSVVGDTTINSDGVTVYLGKYQIDETDAKWTLTETWLQAGLISTSISNGPVNIPGTTRVTHEAVGVESIPDGVLIESKDVNTGGFVTYIRTTLQGDITGIKTTYKDVTDVRVAGTVNLQSIAKSTGGISGTIAVADVTPPRTKTIAAQVTIEITETPPDTVNIAYDLGNISCSVTSISMSENFRGTDVFTTSSGNSRFSGERKTADMSARISTYPECYLSGLTSNDGTFSYTSSYENQSTDPNSIVAVGQNSTTNTFVDGTGSTSADYATTGIIKRNTRPILTAIDGTIYYEVITWEV